MEIESGKHPVDPKAWLLEQLTPGALKKRRQRLEADLLPKCTSCGGEWHHYYDCGIAQPGEVRGPSATNEFTLELIKALEEARRHMHPLRNGLPVAYDDPRDAYPPSF